MPRRVSLPAADDLFRPTVVPAATEESQQPPQEPTSEPARVSKARRAARTQPKPGSAAAPTARRPSGRVRHDEKMTVYITSDELLDLEHARLTLRRDQGLAVDRGRIVREAVALALADLEEHGDDSPLVRRLLAE